MLKTKIAVLLSGGGSNLQALLDAMQRDTVPATVSLVIANKKGVYGLERAKAHRIPTAVFERRDFLSLEERDQGICSLLEQEGIDLVVLAGYLGILTRPFVEKYENRILNIHPSLLPSFSGAGYYGSKVHEAAWCRGVKLTGATVHFVNAETDGGPIILQEAVPILFSHTKEEIAQRVLVVEHRLLGEAVGLFVTGKLRVVGNRVEVLE